MTTSRSACGRRTSASSVYFGGANKPPSSGGTDSDTPTDADGRGSNWPTNGKSWSGSDTPSEASPDGPSEACSVAPGTAMSGGLVFCELGDVARAPSVEVARGAAPDAAAGVGVADGVADVTGPRPGDLIAATGSIAGSFVDWLPDRDSPD
jgi:hypothetical protein